MSVVLALISLTGALTLFLNERRFNQILIPLVAFSAGGLLGGAFFHLIPEAIQNSGNNIYTFLWIVIGFVVFFIFEQFIHFHHCRTEGPKHIEAFSYLAIISDNLHNFLDGVSIAAAFVIDIRLGLAASLAVVVHEIPHELGNFSVLVRGGFTRNRALLFNFLSSLSFLAGGVLTYFVSFQHSIKFLIPFAAGNFIYIAASNLVPEIHKDCHIIRRNLVHFFAFLLGLGLLFLARIYLGE